MLKALLLAGILAFSRTESCPQVVVDVFGNQAEQACDVAWCESRFRSYIRNPYSDATGYFQIIPYWHQRKADYLYEIGYLDSPDLTDPVTNTIVAAVISGWGYDWGAWECKP